QRFVGLANPLPDKVMSTDCPGAQAEGVALVSAGAWAKTATGIAPAITKDATRTRRIAAWSFATVGERTGHCRQDGNISVMVQLTGAGQSRRNTGNCPR